MKRLGYHISDYAQILASIAIIVLAVIMFAREPQEPAIEYVTVEVPAVTVQVVTATPEPTTTPAPTLPADPPQAPTEAPTATPQPTATEAAVDFALLVSVDMPAEVVTGRVYRAVIVVQNAGSITWRYYGVSCPVGLVLIPELAPGQEFTASFDFVAGDSSHGAYEAFEFVVLNPAAEVVPWLPVGGLGAPSPVVGVRTIGYKPTPPSGRKLKLLVEGVLGKGWEACPPGG